MEQNERMSNAVERLLVREVLEYYLASLDKQNWDAIASCFTDDCISHYNDEPEDIHGGQGVAQFLHRMVAYNATSHGMSHVEVNLNGDQTTAHSVVIATMHEGKEGVGRVQVRAIDYQDKLRKVNGEWKIFERLHRPTLQYDALSQIKVLYKGKQD